MSGLSGRFGPLPGGPWPDSSDAAVVEPIPAAGRTTHGVPGMWPEPAASDRHVGARTDPFAHSTLCIQERVARASKKRYCSDAVCQRRPVASKLAAFFRASSHRRINALRAHRTCARSSQAHERRARSVARSVLTTTHACPASAPRCCSTHKACDKRWVGSAPQTLYRDRLDGGEHILGAVIERRTETVDLVVNPKIE
jgi:hypothetical protein